MLEYQPNCWACKLSDIVTEQFGLFTYTIKCNMSLNYECVKNVLVAECVVTDMIAKCTASTNFTWNYSVMLVFFLCTLPYHYLCTTLSPTTI